MHRRRTQGASLVEVLLVVAIGALVLAGAAAHFRTLRQAAALASARREAFQNARVALDRVARTIRCAKQVFAISQPGDTAGTITLTDQSDVKHVFALVGTELRYGVDAATDLLADSITSLRLQGFDEDGAVAPSDPADIDAVQLDLVAAIPGSADTIALSTRAALRRQASSVSLVRSSLSYATTYTVITETIGSPTNALGDADGLYATKGTKGSARFHGFAANTYTGQIERIFAGAYVHLTALPIRLRVYHDNSPVHTYDFTATDLLHNGDQWLWWWMDITEARPYTWSDDDIGKLSIEIGGSGGTCNMDAFAVRAFYDPVHVSMLYADREGDGLYVPNTWLNPVNALASDNVYASADWDAQESHSFRVTVPDQQADVLAVEVFLEAYVLNPYVNDYMEAQAALPTEGYSDTIHHRFETELPNYQGPANEGLMLIDITNDRPWTWAALNDRQIRIKLFTQGSADGIYLQTDALGYRVISVAATERGVVSWSE